MSSQDKTLEQILDENNKLNIFDVMSQVEDLLNKRHVNDARRLVLAYRDQEVTAARREGEQAVIDALQNELDHAAMNDHTLDPNGQGVETALNGIPVPAVRASYIEAVIERFTPTTPAEPKPCQTCGGDGGICQEDGSGEYCEDCDGTGIQPSGGEQA